MSERDAVDLSTSLRTWARVRPNAAAIVEPAAGGSTKDAATQWRSVSFGEFDALVDQYARGLRRIGVRGGDRVIFLVRPTTESLAVLYALSRMQTVPVAIDPGMGLSELLRCVGETRARVVLGVPALHALRLVVRRPFRSASIFLTDGRHRLWNTATLAECREAGAALTAEPRTRADAPVADDDASFIFFTSGSTGTAKPVAVTNTNIWQRLRMVREICGWTEGSKIVACFPSYAPAALVDGGTAILPRIDFSQPAKAPPERIAEAVQVHQAQAVLASPVIWMNLVRYCERSRTTLPTLRQGITAGAPIPISLHQRLLAIMHPQGTLHTPYGATEALPVTSIDSGTLGATWSESRTGRGVCVGTVLPGMHVDVIRISDEPVPVWSDDLRVPDGEIGELVVSGPTVSAEYIGLPDANARAKIRRGREIMHRMGDLGRVDAEGRVWFCGRKADRIMSQGRMLLPVTGEHIFNDHPQVFRSAIVHAGRPAGREVVACVEMERGAVLTAAVARELDDLVRGTPWEGVISRFLSHRGLPVDTRHNSKIRRPELAAWASRNLRRGVRPAEVR